MIFDIWQEIESTTIHTFTPIYNENKGQIYKYRILWIVSSLAEINFLMFFKWQKMFSSALKMVFSVECS